MSDQHERIAAQMDAAAADLIETVAPKLGRGATDEYVWSVCRATAMEGAWSIDDARLANAIICEVGIVVADQLAKREFPKNPIDVLFEEWKHEVTTSRDPKAGDVSVFLARAAEHGEFAHGRLNGMIDVYLTMGGPMRQLTPEEDPEGWARTRKIVDQCMEEHQRNEAARKAAGLTDEDPV